MASDSIALIVAHAGHETTVPVGLRVAIGALAGVGAALLLSPVLLLSKQLRTVALTALGDLVGTDPAAVARSTAAAVFLAAGLVLGALFELTVVWIERVRPIAVIIGGRITVTDLVAVGLIAGLVIWSTRRTIRARPESFTRGDTNRVVVVSIVYGFAVLAAISALHTYLTIPA